MQVANSLEVGSEEAKAPWEKMSGEEKAQRGATSAPSAEGTPPLAPTPTMRGQLRRRLSSDLTPEQLHLSVWTHAAVGVVASFGWASKIHLGMLSWLKMHAIDRENLKYPSQRHSLSHNNFTTHYDRTGKDLRSHREDCRGASRGSVLQHHMSIEKYLHRVYSSWGFPPGRDGMPNEALGFSPC